MTNDWCASLGIECPRLEAVVSHPEANTYALLLVALLERGEPMTLAEVAARFARAGVANESRALLSLQRCKPARPPVYRDGDRYQLDPHDDDLDLWAFRLGLRPPKVASPPSPPVPELPAPANDVALTPSDLDLAFKDAGLTSWSAQRLAVAVLDANGGPMLPSDVVAAVHARTRHHVLRETSVGFGRRGSAISVLPDGRWAIGPDSIDAVAAARAAVRERVALARRHAAMRPTEASIAEARAEYERRRADHAAELARLSRALIVAFPKARPEMVALLDVAERSITTFARSEFDELRRTLGRYDVLGAMDVRALLRSLDVDPGERRLAELGPAQKTMQLSRRGRTLKITTSMLVQGSCGISKPFGDEKLLADYLAAGELTKLRRRIESDVKSLYALHEFGRLHGGVRLRWGFLDEWMAAPWVHRDEARLVDLKNAALETRTPLEIVTGTAPGWAEPWSRARVAFVQRHPSGYGTLLFDAAGELIDEAEIQLARLTRPAH